MTISVTRRLYILCIMLKNRAFFFNIITSLLTQIYERVDITNSRENTCITTSFYKEAHKTRHFSLMCLQGKWEVTYICVSSIDFVTFSTIFSWNFVFHLGYACRI